MKKKCIPHSFEGLGYNMIFITPIFLCRIELIFYVKMPRFLDFITYGTLLIRSNRKHWFNSIRTVDQLKKIIKLYGLPAVAVLEVECCLANRRKSYFDRFARVYILLEVQIVLPKNYL